MKLWTDWEITRRQVSIGGCVTDENKHAVDGARIDIMSTQGESGRKAAAVKVAGGAGWGPAGTVRESTLSGSDGIFYFLDLPDGRYTVNAFDAGTAKHDEIKISVSRDGKGNIRMAQVEFTLRA